MSQLFEREGGRALAARRHRVSHRVAPRARESESERASSCARGREANLICLVCIKLFLARQDGQAEAMRPGFNLSPARASALGAQHRGVSGGKIDRSSSWQFIFNDADGPAWRARAKEPQASASGATVQIQPIRSQPTRARLSSSSEHLIEYLN